MKMREFIGILSLCAALWGGAAQAQEAFGLKLGQTLAEVEAQIGKLEPEKTTILRNAYVARLLPDEDLGVSARYAVTHRNLYFDDAGRLWRVRLRLDESAATYLDPSDTMALYQQLKAKLASAGRLIRLQETPPRVGRGINACRDARAWAEFNSCGHQAAAEQAPGFDHDERVVFDIGCQAAPFWETTYAGAERTHYYVGIRDGNLFYSSVVLAIARLDEDDAVVTDKINRYKLAEEKTE